MKRKNLISVIALLAIILLVSPFFGTVEACKCNKSKLYRYYPNIAITDMGSYSEYVGTLGGASFVIRIPVEWNGMLVVGCHGYISTESFPPNAQFKLDQFVDIESDSLVFSLIERGFAYAASSYGSGGFNIKEAMIRTHQLTKYVIDNFGVTGKVILVGHSEGGCVSLLLGEKYPNLYTGVLDIYGLKDNIAAYEWGTLWASHTVAELRVMLGIPNPPIGPDDATLLFLQTFLTDLAHEMETEFKGNPEERPEAWARYSPMCHADIKIPVISINQPFDLLVSITQIENYATAVTAAGSSEYLKTYIDYGVHLVAPDDQLVLDYVNELVNYPSEW